MDGADDAAFRQLRQVVLRAGGLDLDRYKSRCLLRRIAVRQRAVGTPDLAGYVAHLRRDDLERARLLQTLTIHVSQFFRNPGTFQAIRRQVLPEILEHKRRHGGRALRFWSVGCASGEEPYSLALLLLDAAPAALRTYSCAIYGSDIEPACLRAAAEGRYPPASLAQLPARWRTRYFSEAGGRWQVCREARRLVTLRRHNVLDPPPFRRLDLILFRNVMIYMQEALQEHLLCTLHDVLRPGGFLVLGKVETLVGPAAHGFGAVNIAERIYRRLDEDARAPGDRG